MKVQTIKQIMDELREEYFKLMQTDQDCPNFWIFLATSAAESQERRRIELMGRFWIEYTEISGGEGDWMERPYLSFLAAQGNV